MGGKRQEFPEAKSKTKAEEGTKEDVFEVVYPEIQAGKGDEENDGSSEEEDGGLA